MTSTQSRYLITSDLWGEASMIAVGEWMTLAQRSLRARQGDGTVSRGGRAVGGRADSGDGEGARGGAGRRPEGRFTVLDAREQMVAIKSTLGLNVTELAAILGVQRPTVYAWQAGAAEPHSENGARLRRLYEVALEWSRGCAEPLGGWVRTPLDGSGRSLVTLLSEAAPDAATIVEALRSLRVRIERDAAAMAGVSERARRRGYQDRAQGRQDSAADRETLV